MFARTKYLEHRVFGLLRSHGRQIIPLRWAALSRYLIVAFACLWLAFFASVMLGAEVDHITLPSYLGSVQDRHSGRNETPIVFVIGENHVNVAVQRAVADLIGFLRSAYDVHVVFTEGYGKELKVPTDMLPLEDRRNLARAEINGRHISATEYAALYYPDLRVVGIEDMKAWDEHVASFGRAETDNRQRAEALNKEMTDFLINDLGQQTATEDQIDGLQASLQRYQADQDIHALAATIYEIVGRGSQTGLRLQGLVARVKALEGASGKDLIDTQEQKARDIRMVGNVRQFLSASKGNAVVVVGASHLTGIGQLFAQAGIPYVSIRAAGIDEGPASDGDIGDIATYNEWKASKAHGLEAIFGHIRLPPAMDRPTYRDKLVVTGALFAIDRRFVVDADGEGAKKFISGFNLPQDLRIVDVRGIPGGTQVRFSYQGKVYDARLGPNEGSVRDGGGTLIESGRGGGRSYAIYDRGDQPPSLPPPPKPPGGGNGGPPDDPFWRRGRLAVVLPHDVDKYQSVLKEGEKSNPNMAILVITDMDGRIARILDDNVVRLSTDPGEVAEIAKRLRAAQPGPDKIALAVRLSELLLEGIDDQLPAGKSGVIVLDKGAMLGDLSLPGLAAWSGLESARRFSKLQTARAAFESIQDGSLTDIVSWVAPGVDVGRTAVLVDDRVRAAKGSVNSLSAIRKSGVALNEIRPDTRDLFIVGSTRGGDWRVTLMDGRVLTPAGEEAQRTFQHVEQVVAVNAKGLDRITASRRLTQQETDDDEVALAEVRADVEAISAERGKGKSLEQVRSERLSKDARGGRKILLDKKTGNKELAAVGAKLLEGLTSGYAHKRQVQ